MLFRGEKYTAANFDALFVSLLGATTRSLHRCYNRASQTGRKFMIHFQPARSQAHYYYYSCVAGRRSNIDFLSFVGRLVLCRVQTLQVAVLAVLAVTSCHFRNAAVPS